MAGISEEELRRPVETLSVSERPLTAGGSELDERFHENDPMGFDPTFVIPGCVPAGDSRSERRPGIHSPCGGYGFRARLCRASRVTRAPE